MPYIYVLHFDDKLAHAQHYTGCTAKLRQRLTAHANGGGARLTRELANRGIEWRLGGLMETTQTNMRKYERTLKDQANAGRYCEICSNPPTKLPGTRPYPIGAVPFKATSVDLRDANYRKTPHDVRLTAPGEPDTTQEAIKWLMRADKDALGFIPAAGPQGLTQLVSRGRLAVAELDHEIIGYAAYTLNFRQDRLTIHQCCVRDDARLMGVGKDLVELIRNAAPEAEILAKVRDDLAANHFWRAIGFAQVEQLPHKTSGNLINHYHHEPKE